MRLALLGVAALCAFVAGWQANGWRLERRYDAAELARERAVHDALLANAEHVDKVNRDTRAREKELLSTLETERENARELRHEIETRPVVRQIVPAASAGLGCPALPAVDWGVFRDLYNRAALGEAGAADGGSAAVPGLSAHAF